MTTALAIYFFILGLVCGSFFNVVGLRVPLRQSLIHPPSHCTSCQTRLRKRDLIPLFSYLFARGRCHHCGITVSPVYPFGEAITGILFMSMFLLLGTSLELLTGLLLVSLSIIITVSDLKYMLIPNKVLIAFLPLLVLARLLHHDQPLWHYAVGAILGGGMLLLINLLSRGQMGLGDAKLFFVCGLAIGLPHILVAMLLACLTGSIVGGTLQLFHLVKRKQPIPFGPFLAIGTLAAYCFGDDLIKGYLAIIT
ncbi:A24 family peptidase [Paenibacillus sp. BC26]|uniref:prepilin peptidase n=1 Tax=Paenibacillus sp. BC26 TaxID=1881032 RepID=UPI0008F44053|nr:A24 family peptidase [Paenibacillus sp. BC26]SFT29457.1 type 4 prepilin peptidase 1 Aspartic peptidase. MEROPS family A24A [Paenibacillus sp. BC26]